MSLIHANHRVARAYIMVLSRENYDFIELGKVGKEVIHARSFGCSPTMLPLCAIMSKLWHRRDVGSHSHPKSTRPKDRPLKLVGYMVFDAVVGVVVAAAQAKLVP